jgi:hypothetical protein
MRRPFLRPPDRCSAGASADPFAVGQFGLHVGESSAAADVQPLQLRPGCAGVLAEALLER